MSHLVTLFRRSARALHVIVRDLRGGRDTPEVELISGKAGNARIQTAFELVCNLGQPPRRYASRICNATDLAVFVQSQSDQMYAGNPSCIPLTA